MTILKREKSSIVHCRCVWIKELRKNSPRWKRKSALSPRQLLWHKSIAKMVKLHKLNFELSSYRQESTDLNLNTSKQTSKKRSQETDVAPMKRWSRKLKRFRRVGQIVLLEKRWDDCIILGADNVDEWSKILPQNGVSMCYCRDFSNHMLLYLWNQLCVIPHQLVYYL